MIGDGSVVEPVRYVSTAAAAAVDTYLTGSTTLPSPIPPTERPLVV